MELSRREAISASIAAVGSLFATPKPAEASKIKRMPVLDGPCAGAVAISANGFSPTLTVRRAYGSGQASLYVLTDDGYTYVGVVPEDPSEL